MSPVVHASARPRSPARVCQIQRLAAIGPGPAGACDTLHTSVVIHACQNWRRSALDDTYHGTGDRVESAGWVIKKHYTNYHDFKKRTMFTVTTAYPCWIVMYGNWQCRSLGRIIGTSRSSVWHIRNARIYKSKLPSFFFHTKDTLPSSPNCRAVDKKTNEKPELWEKTKKKN
jgi:hypothetical protein